MNFEFVPYEAEHGAQPLSGGNSYENNLKWSQSLEGPAERLHQIQEIYRRDATAVDGPVDLVYSTNDDDQLAASAIMAQQGFNINARERLDNCWSHQWSRNSAKSEKYERALLMEFEMGKGVLKAIEHIEYLDSYWTTDNLWKSWSDFGRKVAASLLGCEMDGIIPTTNHLESFNGVLKRKHLRRWQNGGRRIRVDILIQVLIIHILPSIFQERRLYRDQELRLVIPKIAYLLPGAERTARANTMLSAGQIGVPTFEQAENSFKFVCYSSEALEIESDPVKYTISVGLDGVVTCTCLDFEKHGGACKHIRGALLMLKRLRASGMPIPAIPIPTSLTDAHALQTKTVIGRAEKTAGPESTERPTIRAATAVADLLREDTAGPVDPESDDDSDDAAPADFEEDVDTDASSDSGDEDDDDVGSRNLFTRCWDTAEFMEKVAGPLSATQREALSEGRGPLAAMVAQIDRLMLSPPASAPLPIPVPATQAAAVPSPFVASE
ncbi:hypothetical protein C8F04DRAFT_1274879 [Mycena alexandri]|uniref:SWIM-type domain-containing protein n=1 Tax=Mycena alexandri TaxID=1745969 RepID=A0AAD6WTN6_9AGAR|nr:hypothetical protein C8F04DRAFT_1274879 [Mycena alexandri]